MTIAYKNELYVYDLGDRFRKTTKDFTPMLPLNH